MNLLHRFAREDDAQDLMEYALLGAFIGIVGILAWQGVVMQVGARYTEFNTNVPLYWEPPDPASAGS